MQQWRTICVAIGGVVAAGFMDEGRVIIGSHSGTGVFDVHTGERAERMHDEHYSWYQVDPPFIRYPSAEGVQLILPPDCGAATWTSRPPMAGPAIGSAQGRCCAPRVSQNSESRTRKSTGHRGSRRGAAPSCMRHHRRSALRAGEHEHACAMRQMSRRREEAMITTGDLPICLMAMAAAIRLPTRVTKIWGPPRSQHSVS
jgi:hypothetical protein